MFPPAREVLARPEGSLAETPFALLLHALFAEERTVVLELRRHQLEKRIAFEDGIPIWCRSNLLHETLGRFLVDRGRLTEADCHEALAHAVREEVPFGEVLVTRGFLSPYDLFRALQQSTARKILDCFTWTDGRYRLAGSPAPDETPLRMNPAQLILTAATTVMPFEVVTRQLAFDDGQRFAKVPDPVRDPGELRFAARDLRLLNLLARRPTFEELCRGARLSGEEATRRLYAFGLLGLAGFAEEVPESPRVALPDVVGIAGLAPAPGGFEPSAYESTAPAGSEPTTPPWPEIEARVNEVMEAFLRHRGQDPFDLFGIGPGATLAEIRKAALAFAERWRPAQFVGPLAQVADKAEELFFAGARATAALLDVEQRHLAIERRARRAEEARRRKGDPGAAFRIQTDLLDAEAQYREGLARLEAGSCDAAVRSLAFACDIDPGKALYRAQLGWARFRSSPNDPDKALADLSQALRTDPACDLAHFHEGRIREATGELAEAEAAYRRALEANPGERRYTDALRAVGSKRRSAR